jgi:leucyl-tRNA synthetase
MKRSAFDAAAYEPRWRETWESAGLGRVKTGALRPFLVVPMFPYPSGKLHVGHVRCYTISDIQARYWRRRGWDVMHPIGWDAFGLPAENSAIKTGVHPEVYTRQNIDWMREQLKEIGMSYDWSREVASSDPNYYRWTQWLFLQLWKHGLAYRAEAPVNWCPSCRTTLANEQVTGTAPTQGGSGTCERCSTPVEAKPMTQWFLRITAYAAELQAELAGLTGWPEHVRRQQAHWIGLQPDGSLHLRDWLVSRQRYWGAPIPAVHCPACGAVPVPEEQLPVRLPPVTDYLPQGRSPLASNESFVRTRCPRCGGPAHREAETLDTFVDSAWYLYRYTSPEDGGRPFDQEAVARWMPAAIYVGGAEHAVLHLLYVRFICKALRDMGWLAFGEPVRRLFTLGMVYKDGAKMSKSKGNAVTQDEMVARYGADTLRLWTQFIAPPAVDVEWSEAGIEGCHRFLKRVFALAARSATAPSRAARVPRFVHRAIRDVTAAIEEFRYNTAISRLMELEGELSRMQAPPSAALTALVHLLAPFAPFAAEEIWHRRGGAGSIHQQPWPAWDEAMARQEQETIVVQVAGRKKGLVTVAAGASQSEVEAAVAADPSLAGAVAGRRPAVFVPGRAINYL